MVLCDPSGYSESASCSSEASHGSGRRNWELRGRPASSGENNASAVTHNGASRFPGTSTIRWQGSWRCLAGPLSPAREQKLCSYRYANPSSVCATAQKHAAGAAFQATQQLRAHSPAKSSRTGFGTTHRHFLVDDQLQRWCHKIIMDGGKRAPNCPLFFFFWTWTSFSYPSLVLFSCSMRFWNLLVCFPSDHHISCY